MRNCTHCPTLVARWEPAPELIAALHDLTGTVSTLTGAIELASSDPWLAKHADAARRQVKRWHDLLEPSRPGADPTADAQPDERKQRWSRDGSGLHGKLPRTTTDHHELASAADPATFGLDIAVACAWTHARGGHVEGCEHLVEAHGNAGDKVGFFANLQNAVAGVVVFLQHQKWDVTKEFCGNGRLVWVEVFIV